MKTGIEKVTIIETDGAGVTTAVVHHDRDKRKGKKTSGWLAIPESMALQGLDAGTKTIKSLRSAHRRSNMKRRDGWLMDLGPNMVKAVSRGRKRIKIQRLFIG